MQGFAFLEYLPLYNQYRLQVYSVVRIPYSVLPTDTVILLTRHTEYNFSQ